MQSARLLTVFSAFSCIIPFHCTSFFYGFKYYDFFSVQLYCIHTNVCPTFHVNKCMYTVRYVCIYYHENTVGLSFLLVFFYFTYSLSLEFAPENTRAVKVFDGDVSTVFLQK